MVYRKGNIEKLLISAKTSVFSYFLIELFRWVIIGILFVFLLGLLFVILQAAAFQENVRSQVNEQETKSVLNTLSEVYRNNQNHEIHTNGKSLQFGEMAVILDRLRSAQRRLSGFEAVAPSIDEAKIQEKGEKDSDQRQNELKSRFITTLNELNKSSRRFIQALESGDKNLYLLSRKNELQKAINDISQYKSKAARSSANIKKGSVENEGVNFEDRVKKLGDIVDTAFSSQLFSQREQLISSGVININQLIKEISDYDWENVDKDPSALNNNLSKVSKEINLRDITTALQSDLGRIESSLAKRDKSLNLANELLKSISEVRTHSRTMELFKDSEFSYTGLEEDQDGLSQLEIKTKFQESKSGIDQAIGQLAKLIEQNTPIVKVAQNLETVSQERRSQIAKNIEREFNSLEKYSIPLYPLAWIGLITGNSDGRFSKFGVDPRSLATSSYDSLVLLFVMAMGALGSLLYVTKHTLESSLQGVSFRQRKMRPLSWLIFRTVFGVVVALVFFLLVKAFQFALGGGVSQGAISFPVFGMLALLVGILSWQLLDLIEGKGLSWFRNISRKDLWATGITNALRNEGWSESKLANQIGRSIEQVQRWAKYEDKVTPELQDRISTSIGRPREELFSERQPMLSSSQQPLWALGLRKAVEDQAIDTETLAEILNTEEERIDSWLKLHKKVPPGSQWTLVGLLNKPHEELFTTVQPHHEAYAVNLRSELLKNSRDTLWLAKEIGKDVTIVRRWAELQEAVPEDFWEPVMDALQCDRSALFVFHPPSDKETWWGIGLRNALAKKYPEEGSKYLAEFLDVDTQQVRNWMELVEPIYSTTGTKRRIQQSLEVNGNSALFEKYYPVREMSKARGVLKSTISNNPELSVEVLSRKLDMSESMLKDIIDEKKDVYVAPETRLVIAEILDETPGKIFKKADVQELPLTGS